MVNVSLVQRAWLPPSAAAAPVTNPELDVGERAGGQRHCVDVHHAQERRGDAGLDQHRDAPTADLDLAVWRRLPRELRAEAIIEIRACRRPREQRIELHVGAAAPRKRSMSTRVAPARAAPSAMLCSSRRDVSNTPPSIASPAVDTNSGTLSVNHTSACAAERRPVTARPPHSGGYPRGKGPPIRRARLVRMAAAPSRPAAGRAGPPGSAPPPPRGRGPA